MYEKTKDMILFINDIQQRLGISRKTFYNLVNDGVFDQYLMRIGGRYAIQEKDLQAFLEAQKIINQV